MSKSNRHGKSIRTQLVLSNVLALALLLGTLGLIIDYAVRSTNMASVDRQLLTRTEALAMSRPPPGMGPQGPFHHGGPFHDGGPPHGFDFGRHDGHPHGPPGPPLTPKEEREFSALNKYRPHRFGLDGKSQEMHETVGPWSIPAFIASKNGRIVLTNIQIEGQPFRLLSRPFPVPGPRQGVIQDVYPLADINRALRGVDRVLLTLSPVALVCAGLVGYFLTGRVLSRVRHMTKAAARIGNEDFSERIPVSGSDEFSELAGTFNGLLGRLEGAIQRQVHLNEQQRRFTADASHELKTPLTIIKGNTGIALKSSECTGDFRESIEEIDHAATMMSLLVRDLLLLAQSDDGRLGEKPISLLVAELLNRAASGIKRQGAAPITLDVAEPSLTVCGNEDEMVRLFSNLLANASQHTPSYGVITVSARRDGAQARIAITDIGPGIAPEHLPHLGERFYRVDTSRSRMEGGTGLGLSICKNILEAHGGSMKFESEVGVGTTVTISLPTDQTRG